MTGATAPANAPAGDVEAAPRTPVILPPLALTMGDPAGIGLEITLKAWPNREALELPVFCFYGSAAALKSRARALGLDVPIVVIDDPGAAGPVFTRAIPVIDITIAVESDAGEPAVENAAGVISSITRAVADARAKKVSAVVTNPIAKSVLYCAGFKHPGHTEFLAALAAQHWPRDAHGAPFQPVMMIACDELKVVPLTIHVPIAQVPAMITRELIATTVKITRQALIDDFGIANPRIVVAGLNPHAGEDGAIGSEERETIEPAIRELVAAGLELIGPLPADTLFHATARATYDAAIAMYHDQALIPIKTLAFDSGVNVTLGLPFVRTSPDHGTAFDIAAKGVASPSSLIEALKLAAFMARRRAQLQDQPQLGDKDV